MLNGIRIQDGLCSDFIVVLSHLYNRVSMSTWHRRNSGGAELDGVGVVVGTSSMVSAGQYSKSSSRSNDLAAS